MKRKPSKWFFLALIIPVIVLSMMLIKPVQTSMMGEVIRLGTVPLDPRDLFYGDYVILDLEIETVEKERLEESLLSKVQDDSYWKITDVFVSLYEGENGLFQVRSVSETKPDGLFIKGTLYPTLYDDREWDSESTRKPYIQLDYEFDRYYVEEGTGRELEELAREGKLIVTAKVYNGYAVLVSVSEDN